MGGQVGKALQERYQRDVAEAMEDVPISKKVELYRELLQQAELLYQLEGQINRSLETMASEEETFRAQEDFLEKRRLSYLKQIVPAAQSDDEEEEDEDDGRASPVPGEEESSKAAGDEGATVDEGESKEKAGLGGIEVDTTTKTEIKAFLQDDLPDLVRTIAIHTRTMAWKKMEYEEKLRDTRAKMEEVQSLLDAIGPGIPALASTSV